MSPDSEETLPFIIPSPGEAMVEVDNEKCFGANNVKLVFEPAVTISGQIRDRVNDKPIKNATVSLRATIRKGHIDVFENIAGSDKRRGDIQAKTDPNGFYVFEAIPSFAWPEDLIQEARIKQIISGDKFTEEELAITERWWRRIIEHQGSEHVDCDAISLDLRDGWVAMWRLSGYSFDNFQASLIEIFNSEEEALSYLKEMGEIL